MRARSPIPYPTIQQLIVHSLWIQSFKILAIIVLDKTVTQRNLTELRSFVITELRTDQIQYSPTFLKRGYNNMVFDSSKTKGKQF